jgi:hypothetical protein
MTTKTRLTMLYSLEYFGARFSKERIYAFGGNFGVRNVSEGLRIPSFNHTPVRERFPAPRATWRGPVPASLGSICSRSPGEQHARLSPKR